MLSPCWRSLYSKDGEQVVGNDVLDDGGDIGQDAVEIERLRSGGGNIQEKIEQFGAFLKTNLGFAEGRPAGSRGHGQDPDSALRVRCAGGLDNLDAGAGADTIRSGGQHLQQVIQRADSARGFYAHLGTDRAAHQLHVVNRGARGAEAGGSFDEVGAGHLRQPAGDDFLIVIEQRGFENHFDDGASAMARRRNQRDFLLHGAVVVAAQCADVLHHVDLLRSGAQGGFGFAHFRFGGSCAERETNHGADLHFRSGQVGRGQGNPIRVHTNAGEIVLAGFGAQAQNVVARGFGPQQRVVDQAGDTRRRVRHKCN